MTTNDRVLALLTALMRCTCFEQAAGEVLRALMQQAAATLQDSPFAGSATLVRGMVHLRPADGYRRLVVLEAGQQQVTGVPADRGRLPSSTAWRLVAEHGCAVSIDVVLGLLRPHLPHVSTVAPLADRGAEPATFANADSRQRLLDRETTHMHVVPLRTPGGPVDGLLSLEVDCRQAIGGDFIWPQCAAALGTLADVAAPYLSLLPVRVSPQVRVDEFLPVIGPSMTSLMAMLEVFARQDETILLGGPTGTGKSRLARWCHERSPRRGRPFESLDLMTVPEELQLGELFGWKNGAFTGATRDNPGCVLRAQHGTLFIDEIDKLSLRTQAGLLYMLETRRYRVLGDGAKERQADVRLIVGTNANLQAAMRAGRFREDLYYRVNVLPVNLPHLAERKDEIPLWAGYMVNRHRDRQHPGRAHGGVRLEPAAQRLLSAQPWPGNLRQLDNIVRRAYTLSVMEQGDGPGEAVLGERHVRTALACENHADPGSLTELLRLAAQAFVAEAERADKGPRPLDLDHADAFKGLVLGTAVQKMGRDEAFRLFGKEALLRGRNHHKILHREVDKAEELFKVLAPSQGGPAASPFAGLVGLLNGEPQDTDGA